MGGVVNFPNQSERRGVMQRFFYTFGSDKKFPYQKGWVEVRAADREESHEKFRARFPDRNPDCINCSFCYTEEQWRKMDPENTWQGYRCHEIIE